MLRAMIGSVFVLALAGCAMPDYSRTDRWPDGSGTQTASRTRGGADGQIETRAPNQRHERDERRSADEECAQYGRVARQQGGRDYSCVTPAEAARTATSTGQPVN